MSVEHRLTAILPVNDLDAAQHFFERLGFSGDDPDGAYRILSDGRGGHIHLTLAEAGWVVPGRNPFGLYLHREDVDAAAAAFAGEVLGDGGPSDTAWGMYEFALNGPDGVLVRVGWPSRLRAASERR